jgi:hypothetical protein
MLAGMTYHHGGMGNNPPVAPTGTWRGPGPNPFAAGAAAPAPTGVDFGVRDLQLRLVRSRPDLVADGAWGAKTRGALEAFARSRGISLPSFGTRGDYKLMPSGKVRVPLALSNALPSPAARGAASARSTPRTSRDAVPERPSRPASSEPSSEGGGGGGEPSSLMPASDEMPSSGAAPWYASPMLRAALPWAAVALAGAAGFFWLTKRRSAATAAAAS